MDAVGSPAASTPSTAIFTKAFDPQMKT
jgi:hypothetical protein